MDLSRFSRFKETEKAFLPKVSIWNKGQIWFSSGAVNKFKLMKYSHIVFLYDAGENEIGFLFTDSKEEPGAIKLGKRENGILVNAKNFLDCYSISYEETRYCIMRMEEKPSLFVIDLVGRRKKQRKEESEEAAE